METPPQDGVDLGKVWLGGSGAVCFSRNIKLSALVADSTWPMLRLYAFPHITALESVRQDGISLLFLAYLS